MGFSVIEGNLAFIFDCVLNAYIIFLALKKILLAFFFCLLYNIIIYVLGFFKIFIMLEQLLNLFFSLAQVFLTFTALLFYYLLENDLIFVALACFSNHSSNVASNHSISESKPFFAT